MTNRYELLYLIPGKYTEEELTPIKSAINGLIEKAGGKITLEDTLGKRKLAYPIKTEHYGYYLLAELELDGLQLKKLSTDIKLTPEILRHTFVKREANAPTFRELTRAQQMREHRQAAHVAAEQAAAAAAEPKQKVSVEELDKKLDEILEGDIM